MTGFDGSWHIVHTRMHRIAVDQERGEEIKRMDDVCFSSSVHRGNNASAFDSIGRGDTVRWDGSVSALLTPPWRPPPANQHSHQPLEETIRGNGTTGRAFGLYPTGWSSVTTMSPFRLMTKPGPVRVQIRLQKVRATFGHVKVDFSTCLSSCPDY
ncbi:hypothetical protein F2P81_006540 [Scophthalmus maximus]|uniref:Uncharacterized protein n=1 Tax=Scophthalmus maximus TaxID=52904 RepID=A0A6A4TEB8_SCOMX|nr:hypothetical protein F2P81_006540 [Scophthalmus maximus]